MQNALPARAPLSRYLALSAYWFGFSFHWFFLLPILMPADVERLVGAAQKGTYLGWLSALAAIIPLVLPPFLGAWSDRIGKRMVFLTWGTAINVAGLAIMLVAPGFAVYVVGYLLVQFGNSVASSPYTALIPDVVPEGERGRASGVMGFFQLFSQIAGGVVAFALGGSRDGQYLAIIVVLTISMLITYISIREPQRHRGESHQAVPNILAFISDLTSLERRILLVQAIVVFSLGFLLPPVIVAGNQISGWALSFLFALFSTALALLSFAFRRSEYARLEYRDFRWVFLTRAFTETGRFAVQPFLAFYLADVIGSFTVLGFKIEGAGLALTLLFVMLSVTAAVTAAFSGSLSDRIGKRPVVLVASLAMAAAALGFALARNYEVAVLIGLAFGLGYGAFVSVDWALGTSVLPYQQHHARDMGVWHIAFVFPQLFQGIFGQLLDAGNAASKNGGYPLLFGVAVVFFVLGGVFVSKVRGVR
jgi:MFS family permease